MRLTFITLGSGGSRWTATGEATWSVGKDEATRSVGKGGATRSVVQVKLPTVLVQVALATHPPLSVAHSSISTPSQTNTGG